MTVSLFSERRFARNFLAEQLPCPVDARRLKTRLSKLPSLAESSLYLTFRVIRVGIIIRFWATAPLPLP